MSACRFWWRAGEVGWCDMLSKACQCDGWDDCCDMKSSSGSRKAKPTGGIHVAARQSEGTGRKLRRAA